MPWTFAHPAAVLPLRRLFPGTLGLPALVAGSLAPDLGYYLGAFRFSGFAHTLAGSFIAALPSALLLLAAFCLVRRPLWYLLPQPHRTLLARSAHGPLPGSAREVASLLASAWLGAASHLAWDAFTHQQGWVAARLPLLQQAVHDGMPLYELLQHASTVLGMATLFIAYRGWLRANGECRLLAFGRRDRWRYALVTALAVLACGLAIGWAGDAAARAAPQLVARVFVFRAAVYGAALFLPLLAIAATACYACRRIRAPSPS